MIKELSSQIEKARGGELTKQGIGELEKRKQAKLEEQIMACTLRALATAPWSSQATPAGTAAGPRLKKGRSSASGRSSSACPTSPR